MTDIKAKKSIFNSLLFKLVIAIIIGIFLGNISNEGMMQVISTIKTILSLSLIHI